MRGETLRANFVGKTQTPKVLHGPCLGGIGLWVECRAGFGIDQQAPNVSSTQFVGKHQTKRSAARNQHIGFNGFNGFSHIIQWRFSRHG